MNVPTWTGRHGASGAVPEPAVRRFGNVTRAGPTSASFGNGNHFGGSSAGVSGGSTAPSSANLLAHLRQRQQQVNAAGVERF